MHRGGDAYADKHCSAGVFGEKENIFASIEQSSPAARLHVLLVCLLQVALKYDFKLKASYRNLFKTLAKDLVSKMVHLYVQKIHIHVIYWVRPPPENML